MLKVMETIGLPIIDLQHGNRKGYVKDILFDADWRICAVLLSCSRWFIAPRYISSKKQIHWGQEAVTISQSKDIQQIALSPGWFGFAAGPGKFKDTAIITEQGNRLGTIVDVYFYANSVKPIIGFEISDGFISDIWEGRRWLPLPNHVTKGQDAIIVPISSEHALKEIITTGKE